MSELSSSSWFSTPEPESESAESAGSADDAPTGQIPALDLSRIVAEADRAGTAQEAPASETGVELAGVMTPPADRGPAEFADIDRALADRQALIQLCLYALDRARSGGVVERLEQGLAGIGIEALRPDGQRFDPAVHEAGGSTPTEDRELEGIIAETEVVGFADHGRLLRAPIVIVYTRR